MPSCDSAIETILRSISFLCLGVTSLAAFTFVLVLKRLQAADIYLYSSSFLAFATAVLDLGKILAQIWKNTVGPSLISGITDARRVGLALSLGLNYLFFWKLVAQCPRGEKSSQLPTYTHSASWKQWGTLGLVLKWGLLGLTLLIPALQISWRLGHEYSVMYIAEATTEVVVSVLFILKLALNAILSPLTNWRQHVLSSAAPCVALFISASLGVGNLIAREFSESTRGQFLRALELYILTLFSLITSFYDISRSPLPRSHEVRASPSPVVTVSQRLDDGFRLPLPASWIPPRTTENRQSTGQVPKEKAEFRMAPDPPMVPGVGAAIERKQTSTEDDDDTILKVVSLGEGKERPIIDTAIPSYYEMEHASTTLPPPISSTTKERETYSPVYGLNGIVYRRAQGPPSNSSIEELTHWQDVLDKEISGLELLVQAPGIPPPISSSSGIKGYTNPLLKTASSWDSPKSELSQSDVSLSGFPQPPARNADSLTANMSTARIMTRTGSVAVQMPVIVPLRGYGGGIPSLPDRFGRSMRVGTQYDVTSFIDDLTVPSNEPVVLSGGTSTLDDVKPRR